MEDNMKEFVAFSRKLLRTLKEIRELLDKDDKECYPKGLVVINCRPFLFLSDFGKG